MELKNGPVNIDHKKAVKNYLKAVTKSVVKTMAKMGISTMQSYCGAQIFEAIGLNHSVIDKYFTWTASQIEGVGIDVLAEEVRARHRHAFPVRPVNGATLDAGPARTAATRWAARWMVWLEDALLTYGSLT